VDLYFVRNLDFKQAPRVFVRFEILSEAECDLPVSFAEPGVGDKQFEKALLLRIKVLILNKEQPY